MHAALTRVVAHQHSLNRHQTSSRMCAGSGATAKLVVNSTIASRQTTAVTLAPVCYSCMFACGLPTAFAIVAHISSSILLSAVRQGFYGFLQSGSWVFGSRQAHRPFALLLRMSDRWHTLRSLFGGQPTRTASGSLDRPYPAPAQQVHHQTSDVPAPTGARMRFSNLAKRVRRNGCAHVQRGCVPAIAKAAAARASRGGAPIRPTRAHVLAFTVRFERGTVHD